MPTPQGICSASLATSNAANGRTKGPCVPDDSGRPRSVVARPLDKGIRLRYLAVDWLQQEGLAMTTTVTALAQDIGLARETDYYLMKDQLTEMGLPQCELRRSPCPWLPGSLSVEVSIGVPSSVQRRRLW